MTQEQRSRRDLLKTAFALTAASLFAPHRSAAAIAAEPGEKNSLRGIDAIIRQAVEAKDVPGVVAMVANEKGVVYEGSFGKRDIAKPDEMTLDSVFWIASMTKAVTAAAAMRLVEQGKLRLDQPMGKLLPGLASPQVLEGFDANGTPKLRPAKRPITLQHLLTHTSGFTYDMWDADTGRYEKYAGLPNIITCKNDALKTPLAFDPGDRWEYGIGMDWAGKAVEAASGQLLDVHLREQIFAPLGMSSTSFILSPQQRARLVGMHARQADGSLQPMPFELNQNPEFFMGGGGLYSTAGDYLAFQQMLLHGGRFNGVQILKPETVAEMRKNHIGKLNAGAMKTAIPAYTNDVDFFPGMELKWGLSFLINTKEGPAGRSAGSLTWAGLANTYYWIDPIKRLAGVILLQLLPFADAKAVKLYAQFERGVYQGMAQA